jgi:hypothetical protein
MLTNEPPFATEKSLQTQEKGVDWEGSETTWDTVAHNVLYERQIWAAAKLHGQLAKPAHPRRRDQNLLAADAMWFDSSAPMLQHYPLRACWGRYRS